MNAIKIYEDAKWKLEHNEITLGEFEEMIKPLEDVRENIHGEWKTGNEDWGMYYCSHCRMEFVLLEGEPSDNEYNFCPNCGSNMRERKGKTNA